MPADLDLIFRRDCPRRAGGVSFPVRVETRRVTRAGDDGSSLRWSKPAFVLRIGNMKLARAVRLKFTGSRRSLSAGRQVKSVFFFHPLLTRKHYR